MFNKEFGQILFYTEAQLVNFGTLLLVYTFEIEVFTGYSIG